MTYGKTFLGYPSRWVGGDSCFIGLQSKVQRQYTARQPNKTVQLNGTLKQMDWTIFFVATGVLIGLVAYLIRLGEKQTEEQQGAIGAGMLFALVFAIGGVGHAAYSWMSSGSAEAAAPISRLAAPATITATPFGVDYIKQVAWPNISIEYHYDGACSVMPDPHREVSREAMKAVINIAADYVMNRDRIDREAGRPIYGLFINHTQNDFLGNFVAAIAYSCHGIYAQMTILDALKARYDYELTGR